MTKRDTKQQLLEKGVVILTDKGYHHTGINEVLKEVGVPKGSFYHFFSSKQDFALQVLRRYCEGSAREAREILENPARAPLERLRDFFLRGREKVTENQYRGGCLIGNLSQEMGDQCEDFARCLEAKWRELQGLLAHAVAAAQGSGQIKNRQPADQIAGFLVNGWQGTLIRVKVSRSRGPMDLFIETVFGRILI